MYSRLFCYENAQQRSLRRAAAELPVSRYAPLVKMGDRKVHRLSCPPKIQNILPLNMARAHAAAIWDGLACPVHKAGKSSIFQQPSPAQRAFTFCTAAATRLPMGWSGTPTM